MKGVSREIITREIKQEYVRLDYKMGWRFLTCPFANIQKAEVALVTTNPGGSEYENPLFETKKSAYIIESWKRQAPGEEKLQRQVRRMFELCKIDPNAALSGYFIPFRSQDWESLPRKGDAIRFGMRLWEKVIAASPARMILAFGKQLAPHLSDLLGAKPDRQFCAGWGARMIDCYVAQDGRRLMVLPHLSRFGLFHRSPSEEAFMAALAHCCSLRRLSSLGRNQRQ